MIKQYQCAIKISEFVKVAWSLHYLIVISKKIVACDSVPLTLILHMYNKYIKSLLLDMIKTHFSFLANEFRFNVCDFEGSDS